jgi:Uma2 family endonuclease
MATRPKATIKDLYHLPEDGKAEIVNGELISRAPTGFLPGRRAAGTFYLSLREYERSTKVGFAFPDNTGFKVELSHRESFSPDAAFYTGKPTGMKFPEGAPIFAAEVRSEGDYGPGAEQAIADKIDRKRVLLIALVGVTTVALLGTLASLALTAILSEVFVGLAQISGFASEEAVIVSIGSILARAWLWWRQ